ncbi:Sporulation and spore germination [compost metagenome]
MLVLLLAISAGCGQKPQTAAPNTSEQQNGTTVNGSGSNSTSTTPDQNSSNNGSKTDNNSNHNGDNDKNTDQITQSIETYFTDDQMLELVKETKEIVYTKEQDKYITALQSLQSSSNSDLFPLWGKVNFHSASLKEGMLTIDISLPDEARLGAGGEILALDSLKKTMFQFSEVQSIELLVDSQQVDTLMGHEELEHPMKRN